MFTGIIKEFGTITNIEKKGTNIDFTLTSNLTKDLNIDQSVAHNGVCLTIVKIENNEYVVTAVLETLKKTTLGIWKIGDEVNLELAIQLHTRLDGHFVQGHVDTFGRCEALENVDGSHLFTFSFPEINAGLVIEKGSICINGVSLTLFNVTKNSFQVTIIPYTFEHTTFKHLNHGSLVNLEFDIIGKYILRQQQLA